MAGGRFEVRTDFEVGHCDGSDERLGRFPEPETPSRLAIGTHT